MREQDDWQGGEVFTGKTKQFGYLPPAAPTAEELSSCADTTLFKAVTSDQYHVLYGLLPATRTHGHNLRPRAHHFELPVKDDRNFLPRMLYRDVYLAIIVDLGSWQFVS